MSQRVPIPVPAGPQVSVDPTARTIGMLGFGAAGMRVVRCWIEQVPAGLPVTWAAAQQADSMSLAELERLVQAAGAGWRLMLAGPAADVRAARETAIGLGMHAAGIRTTVTGRAPRRVWCPHCTATTDTEVLPGESVPCAGCTVPLRVPASPYRSPCAHLGVAGGTPHVA